MNRDQKGALVGNVVNAVIKEVVESPESERPGKISDYMRILPQMGKSASSGRQITYDHTRPDYANIASGFSLLTEDAKKLQLGKKELATIIDDTLFSAQEYLRDKQKEK